MKQQGFSLIELMIAVAILGIIAAVAYPSYTSYVQDARRAEGQGAMLEAAQWMERQFTVDGTYLDGDGNSRVVSAFNTEFYNITVSASNAATFTIQGAPTGAQASDSCGNLTITNIGVKGDSDANQDCWD